MIRVPIHQLTPGMVLAQSIAHPENPDRILLNSGYSLDQRIIDRIESMNRKAIWIACPGLEGVEQYVNPHLLTIRAQLTATIEKLFRDLNNGKTGRWLWTAYDKMMDSLFDEILNDPKAAVYCEVEEATASDDPLVRHSSNVCYLTSLLGLRLQGYLIRQRNRLSPTHASNVRSLCKGAVFHDIGIPQLSEEVFVKWTETRDENDPRWRAHVENGYRLVAGRIESTAAAAVLQHHQYVDGSGFPVKKNWEGKLTGLTGSNIHIFARIITVADHFDEYKNQPDGTIWPSVRVLRTMLTGSVARRFDPNVLRILFQIVPAFPLGSQVHLSDGRTGYVSSWDQSAPCRPKVVLISDLESLLTKPNEKPQTINLKTAPEVSIVAVEGHEVSSYTFDLPKHLLPEKRKTKAPDPKSDAA